VEIRTFIAFSDGGTSLLKDFFGPTGKVRRRQGVISGFLVLATPQLIAHSKDFSNVGDGEASPTGKIQVVKAVAGE
jgi:hypothetical protein